MDSSAIDVPLIAVEFVVLLLALTVHESAHAWTADRFGDPTARMLGRVSLNPLPHIDPIGTIVFPLIALFTHVPLLGWAKPTPVNPANLRNPRWMGLWISAAGPLSNILLATLFLLFAAVGARSGAVDPSTARFGTGSNIAPPLFILICYVGLRLNLMLAVFNLLPISPLDGGGVLAGLLPSRIADAVEEFRPFGLILLVVILIPIVGGRSILHMILAPVYVLVNLLFFAAVSR